MTSGEDETWDALEELYREGRIDVEPSGDPDDPEPSFSLTEHGLASVRDGLRENDEMVLFLIRVHLSETVERRQDESEIAERLIELAEWVRDDVGVNIFRVMKRNPEAAPVIDIEDLGESFIQWFDSEADDE
jgi:hypothetical protein